MMSMEQDHYGVLELEQCSPMEDVKSQYRRLAKRDHPDLHGNDARSQEQFRRVNAAYTFLSDAPRKAAYDAVLQAARRAGAPPLGAAPSPKPSPGATSYRVPVTAAGYHEEPRDAVRMTRSAWLGATAGAIVVLLVIGLSVNGSGPGRPTAVGVGPPVSPGSASESAGGNGMGDRMGEGGEPGGGSGPGADTDSPMASPAVPSATPVPFASPTRPAVAGGAWMTPRAVPAAPAEPDPSGVLRQRLLARSRAALPRTDRLLNRGYAVRAAGVEIGNGARRVLREQLRADLADLSAARARVRPGLDRLAVQGSPEGMRRKAAPTLTDLGRLEDAGKPVRNDIRALTSPPAASVSTAAAPKPAMHAPAVPAPAVASATLPKPPEKPAPDPPAKPKARAASGQEFIMWGK